MVTRARPLAWAPPCGFHNKERTKENVNLEIKSSTAMGSREFPGRMGHWAWGTWIVGHATWGLKHLAWGSAPYRMGNVPWGLLHGAWGM